MSVEFCVPYIYDELSRDPFVIFQSLSASNSKPVDLIRSSSNAMFLFQLRA